MKIKLIFLFLLVLGSGLLTAQERSLGIELNVGLPIGDIDYPADYVVGGEVDYMFSVRPKLEVGPAISLNHFFISRPKNYNNAKRFLIMPIAFSTKYSLWRGVRAELDFGLALGIKNISGGDFYFKPSLSFKLGSKLRLNGFYSNAAYCKYSGIGLSYHKK